MSTTDPLYGKMVKVQAILGRDRDTPGKRVWKRNQLPEPVEALVIGWRTLADGTITGTGRMDYWGEYDPKVFYPERHFKAYVVVLSERTNPLYVSPEDVST